MKNFIILFSLMFTVAHGFSSNIIEDLSSDKVDFVITTENTSIFTAIDYNEETQNISLKTIEDIAFIKVLNDKQEIEFQMPIGSKSLHLFMQDFTEGVYEVLLMIDGQEIQTQMTIK